MGKDKNSTNKDGQHKLLYTTTLYNPSSVWIYTANEFVLKRIASYTTYSYEQHREDDCHHSTSPFATLLPDQFKEGI